MNAYVLSAAVGLLVGVIYGVLIQAPPLLAANGVPLLLAAAILGVKLRYGEAGCR